MKEAANELVLVVFTTDGKDRTHTYPLTESWTEETKKLVAALIDKLVNAIYERDSALLLEHPSAIYKA